MPMFEQAMTPLSRWQMTQRSVHTAQPSMPDCVAPPALGRGTGKGTGPSSSVVAGGVPGTPGACGAAMGGPAVAGASLGDPAGGVVAGGDVLGEVAGGIAAG
jgi:hypothetical protein